MLFFGSLEPLGVVVSFEASQEAEEVGSEVRGHRINSKAAILTESENHQPRRALRFEGRPCAPLWSFVPFVVYVLSRVAIRCAGTIRYLVHASPLLSQ